MAKIIIIQSVLWAAAIISTGYDVLGIPSWLLLTVLATMSLGFLKYGLTD